MKKFIFVLFVFILIFGFSTQYNFIYASSKNNSQVLSKKESAKDINPDNLIKEVSELKKYSEKELIKLGYDKKEVEVIKNFGSYSENYLDLGGKVIGSSKIIDFKYDKKTEMTTAHFRVSFNWIKRPMARLEDEIRISWSKDFLFEKENNAFVYDQSSPKKDYKSKSSIIFNDLSSVSYTFPMKKGYSIIEHDRIYDFCRAGYIDIYLKYKGKINILNTKFEYIHKVRDNGFGIFISIFGPHFSYSDNDVVNIPITLYRSAVL